MLVCMHLWQAPHADRECGWRGGCRTRFIEHLADSDMQQAEDAAASQGGGQQLQASPRQLLPALLCMLEPQKAHGRR